jgi:AcrR family transcriptional regulator
MALIKPRRMRSADRREQLLDTTLDLVTERGFHVLTIEAVAQAAGVTRPIVYKQFDDLSGLVEALIEREEDRALTQLARAIPNIPGDRDPDDLLVSGLQLFLEAVVEAPKTWRLILLPPEGVPSSVAERTKRTRASVLRQLEKLVAWGIERRGGPHGLDSELFARLILEMAEDSARLVLTQPKKFPVERIVRFTATLMEAVRRDSAAGAKPPPQLRYGRK